MVSHFCSRSFGYIYVITLFIVFHPSDAQTKCYSGSTYYYCDYGCCEDTCCGMSIVSIVGVTISAIVALAALISCIVCLVCMCKQSGMKRGTVVQPYHHNANAVYVHNAAHPPPGPPPGYGHYSAYPSSSNYAYNSYNDYVYPPGVLQSGSQPTPPAYSYVDPQAK